MRILWSVVLLTGCLDAELGACEAVVGTGAGPTDEAELQQTLDAVRETLADDLVDNDITLNAIDSDSDYFTASVRAESLDAPPEERAYLLNHSVQLFADPPPAHAVAAIVVHELAHIRDYTGMDEGAFVDFVLWYGTTDDVSAYERETDEVALRAGCGAGLSAYREWLYDHVDAQTEAQKRLDYYTPEEIEAWMTADEGGR